MVINANSPNHQTTKQSYEDFRDYLLHIGSGAISYQELDELYNKHVTIEFNGHVVNIPFDAVVYHELLYLIETMIKEY